MEHLPIPHLYRGTNSHSLIPSVDSFWVSDCGDIVKVTKVLSRESITTIYYKKIFLGTEFSLLTHEFHSMFSSFDIL